MKELTGVILRWDPAFQRGEIAGDDGQVYTFSSQHWTEAETPEIDGGVRFICENGRDVSTVEYILIEHMPILKVEMFSPQGTLISSEKSRLIGGPWRMHSDALAWMKFAQMIHGEVAGISISDISELLRGDHYLISARGSVVKYCYGIALELYFKWILTEAGITYPDRGELGHKLSGLLASLPTRVLSQLRTIYSDYLRLKCPEFRMLMAHVHGVDEVARDWSTLDRFVKNVDELHFVTWRYAKPEDYSAFHTLSSTLSKEMNMYLDSDDFFELGNTLLASMPNVNDYTEVGGPPDGE